MRFYKQNTDDAVSPVIGVILMVAVTVILAAVIGTFILGLGDNVQENPQAAVSFTENPGEPGEGTVEVLIISTGNVDTLEFTTDDGTWGNDDTTVTESDPSVGDRYTLTVGEGDNGNGQIVLTGVVNGNEAVIQVEPFDFS